ncbi:MULTISPECIES: M13 family metallopeptidase [unclassified Leeuwenhoekiella]|uniref:M13 family metallopeptidase n=1 Tax=unclassified Leeuwenhoekiella TaxID=2615029 RepID=UPI000C41DA68|nr:MULTISPECIES: M13 family metallopeptidase [unclassified Leeuwenhoekiella]MAW96157.1 endothelin-converting protein [Leeuwenhoekiella sp.]MBA80151.1 endothelin-converting protein [Leeuwenhoekiella sp.]|tara:strand:- start:22659 stop:24725 length:2067 start_codon:yes stop_codon:yes gene_type:complete
MKSLFKTMIPVSIGILSLTACKDEPKNNEAVAELKTPALDLANMDTLVRPQDDFYDYVNGNWMKTTEIPEEESVWGGFSVLRKKTREDVLAIIEEARKSNEYAAGSDQAKALALFESELDTVARNEAGLKPLQPALDSIAAIKSVSDIQRVGQLRNGTGTPFFNFRVFSDFSNSNMNTGYITPGRLGLPDRDYYLEQDAKSKEIREQYKDYISWVLQYAGDDEATAKEEASRILALETKLSEPQLDKVARRDARNMNNPRSVAQLQKMTPAVDWKAFFDNQGLTKAVDTVIVLQPKYMTALQNVLSKTPIEDLKLLMRWATSNGWADALTTEMEYANWEFYSKTLNGTPKQKPADERALATVDGTLGEALGKLYVDKMFPPEAKAKAEAMIGNIKEAFRDRINNLEWMTDSTKMRAIDKLNKFTVKIGYPDKWEDYSKLEISADKNFFENRLAAGSWSIDENNAEYKEPVDKSKWGMSPQTVNAYFNPSFNEIVFPAAILQPPFYNYQADEAVNYGGIGAVIGHEISHAFDDSGSRYDGDGNLKNWWSDADLEAFTERSGALADQYSAIEVADSLYINGKFTLGENIGDLGGLLAAYSGLQKFYEKNGRPGEIDGLTPEQRFFISWATIWRTKMRDDALRTRIKTDPHSPGMYRAYVPLQNIDAFYEAFDIKEGDPMFVAEEDRVRIW